MAVKLAIPLDEKQGLRLRAMYPSYCVVEFEGKRFYYKYGRLARKNLNSLPDILRALREMPHKDSKPIRTIMLDELEKLLEVGVKFPKEYVEFMGHIAAIDATYRNSHPVCSKFRSLYAAEFNTGTVAHSAYIRASQEAVERQLAAERSEEKNHNWREFDASW